MTGHLGLRIIAGAAVVVALAGCGGSPSQHTINRTEIGATATSESRSNETTPNKASDQKPVDSGAPRFETFRSPTGNVGCYVSADNARCDIAERDWPPPPRPTDCEFDYGQGISINPGEPAAFVCAGDTALAPDARPLPYGQSLTVEPMFCESAESGITCRDTNTRHGFSIAREAYHLF